MTIIQAIKTIIQQNKQLAELLANGVGGAEYDDSEIKNKLTEINATLNSVDTAIVELNRGQNAIVSDIDNNANKITDIKDKHDKFFANIGASYITNNKLNEIIQVISAGLTNGSISQVITQLARLGDNYKSLYTIANTLYNFLNNADVADTTINRWKEIENFLQGITDTDTLTGLLEELRTNILTTVDNNTTVKGVDGITIITDDNGIAKSNMTTSVYKGWNTGSITTDPVKYVLAIVGNEIKLTVTPTVYISDRAIQPNSNSLVLEKGLYKEITTINETINSKTSDLFISYSYDTLVEDELNDVVLKDQDGNAYAPSELYGLLEKYHNREIGNLTLKADGDTGYVVRNPIVYKSATSYQILYSSLYVYNNIEGVLHYDIRVKADGFKMFYKKVNYING